MYIIIDSKNVIAEICKHPCYVRTQTNGVTILSDQNSADAIYSNDTDTFYGVRRVGAADAYRFVEVGDIPDSVQPGHLYKDGEFVSADPTGTDAITAEEALAILLGGEDA